jgi:hypothetical protein
MNYEKMWNELKIVLGHKRIYAKIAENNGRYDLYTLLKDEMVNIEIKSDNMENNKVTTDVPD